MTIDVANNESKKANTLHAETRCCKICGSNAPYACTISSDVQEPSSLDMHVCSNCGLLFVHNPLSESEMSELYAQIDREKWFYDSATYVDKKNRLVARVVESLMPGSFDNISLLDVGCGDGHLLELIRDSQPSIRGEGYELPGCDEAAKAKGLTVHTCPVSEIPELFDFTTLVDVIEHVSDPTSIIEAVGSRVKSEGNLIIYTPRRCFVDTILLAMRRWQPFRSTAEKWFSTRLSIWHVQVYSDTSIKRALAKNGFDIVSLKSLNSFSAPIEYFLKRMRCPKWAAGPLKLIVELVSCRLGLLRTKTLCIAVKRH